VITAVLTATGISLVIVSGPLYRFEWLGLGGAIDLLRFGAMTSLVMAAISAIIAAICLFQRRARLALVGALMMLAAVTAFAVPWSVQREGAGVPPIHDITTDPDDPPAFLDLAPARAAAPNAVDYPGEAFARQQRAAYPDVAPLELADTPAAAFRRAQRAAAEMGWEIVTADPADGRIEAVATTRWFGFRDDVVVRVTPTADGSRIDVRSASRVGRGDLGANAARIRDYLRRMKD